MCSLVRRLNSTLLVAGGAPGLPGAAADAKPSASSLESTLGARVVAAASPLTTARVIAVTTPWADTPRESESS